MKNHHEVLIVGGGVIGHSISYYLNKSGVSATVMEKGESGHQATRAAAGMLGVHTENKRSGEFYGFYKESRDLYKSLRQELYELTSIDIQLVSFGMLEVALNENEAQKLWENKQPFLN
ncbi:NAD(P)/FAD-dependent oxidoreductase [Virgibacillus proomii]|uniref:NAD(P)/FAD-dependent oxidoreductase n=1 Tax=Virgibacillus proomii TaxID=84407 RepID=UPI001C117584|nr:FAD-dependent oxidoreductase [Virgibacillus proomii]MBU5266879.1 FAD-binding oxidoreductase [Virgibacillus proomii]